MLMFCYKSYLKFVKDGRKSFGFVTEYRAEKSVEALRKIIISTAKVLRDGEVIQINSVELVPGDIIIFEEGDKVTADARLFSANNLYVDEAILTGESNPISKYTQKIETDKTGTLTENQMTVQEIFISGKIVNISGAGYEPEGIFIHKNEEIQPLRDEQLNLLLKAGFLCSNAKLGYEEGTGWSVIGDPTEGALITAAQKAGYDINHMELKRYERIAEIPFDSERKFMAVLTGVSGKGTELFLKGAPEVVFEICSKVLVKDEEIEISREMKLEFLNENKLLAQKGLRVICLAYKKNLESDAEIEKEIDGGLVFIGLAGILDLPRMDIKRAVEEAQSAGIRIIMITGDQKETAISVAKQIGLNPSGENVTSAR